jgi:MFS transporter, BCD family, chlorophyll transporter
MRKSLASVWSQLGPGLLPFADAGSPALPLSRLLRLSLFQVSVGIELVLLNGTLNRVMIVELGIAAWLVSFMIALPIVFAPLRALIGHRSDHHRSVLGWRRVPYVWMGTLIQFGGLAILPFALLVLSGRGTYAPKLVGELCAGLSFLMIGIGLHTSQTAGVALATDLAPKESRPRVVALLYVMLLIGMVGAALSLGALLRSFSYIKLIQVIQGAAMVTIALNLVALWKQEGRGQIAAAVSGENGKARFSTALRTLLEDRLALRLLVAVGLGTAGFSMQDILLEPYGGELLRLSVSATTSLTAIMALGTLCGLYFAARGLSRGKNPHQLAAHGALIGVVGLSLVIFAGPLRSLPLFWAGTSCIGFGNGWFSVGTLSASMELSQRGESGIVIGAWGAVQATVAGAGIALAGLMRDGIGSLAVHGSLGQGLRSAAVGYSAVYQLEIVLLFGAMIAIGPLVRMRQQRSAPTRFGLLELPN